MPIARQEVIRHTGAEGYSQCKIAKKLEAGRNIVAKYAGKDDFSPELPLSARRKACVLSAAGE